MLTFLYAGYCTPAFGQTPKLDTEPLAVTAICAGAQLDVTGFQDNVGTDWRVELSNGGEYYEIPSIFLSTSGRYETTYRAIIPANTPAGTTYKIRVVSKNPLLAGTPSATVLTIYAAPPVPTVSSLTYCQGTTPPSLSAVAASGGTLAWYTSATSSTSSAVGPAPSTTSIGTTNYYVGQTVNGGCESPRVTLGVTVSPVPATPIVTKSTYTYCQNVPGEVLSATGQNLKWYEVVSGGVGVGALVPNTVSVGTKQYYVSQNISGCESPRSSVTVVVTAIPPAPTVAQATYEFCQGTTNAIITGTVSPTNSSGWTIYSDEPPVVTLPVNGSTVSATVSTIQARILTYSLFQIGANGCKSPASALVTVTIKPTPGAPVVQAVTVCQNAPAQSLSATGQNLIWYTSNTSSTTLPAAPVVSTSQVSQTTYFVSQSLNGCESARATLVATVKALPAAPTVAPKNLCQFATPELVSAPGENLTWYSADDTKLSSAPLINTDRASSFTVKVTQTVNGCESPKATLTVTVLTTPAPTVSTPIIELCQGSPAQSLSAIGTNLKWTDPAGTVLTTAPVLSTAVPTAKPDGDLYYVTQTGTTGCESTKVAIHVFVQTTPTMSISGNTTTNLGLEVPLQLTFTGVGPYRYKLSTGMTGIATKDTIIRVLPERTTTYQVSEVSNKCGVGRVVNGASATIAVLVPGIQTLALTTTTLCAGASLATNFLTNGTFNPGSVFKLQLAKVESDSAKINFVDVAGSQATNGRIAGTLSNTVVAGTYWVRVVATNPKIPINGNISPTVLTIRPLPTAVLTGNQSVFDGQPASLSVAFTGDGPWSFSYRDSTITIPGPIQTVQATTNPYVLEVRPQKTTTYYLTGVSNGCGNGGRVSGTVVVVITPLLGVDDQSLADAVSVYPIPATTTLTVKITGLTTAQPALIELTDLTGRTTLQYETRQPTSSLKLDQHAAGTYILRVRVGDRTASRRIVKM